MTRHSLLMMAALVMLLLQACEPNTDDYSSTREIAVEELTPIRRWPNGACWATISATDVTTFTVTGKGKYANTTTLDFVTINGLPDQTDEGITPWTTPIQPAFTPIQRGSWGEVEYLTTRPPYTMQFRVAPNLGSEARIIRFGFGYTPDNASVILYQPALEVDDTTETASNNSNLRI